MKKNMSNIDRTIRVLIAFALAGLYWSGMITGTIGIILLVVSGIFILTSLVSFCPIYRIFGISSCKVPE